MANILVVDDEESIRFTFAAFLEEEGHVVAAAADFREALDIITGSEFDLIFMDIILGSRSGIELLSETVKLMPNCPVIIITGNPNVETASDALRLGAFDYIFKPIKQKNLVHSANLALKYKAIQDENKKYRLNLEAIFNSVNDSIITVDKNMVITSVNKAAYDICGISQDIIGRPFNDSKDEHICGQMSNSNCKCLDALKKTITEKQDVEFYRTECTNEGLARQVVTINVSPLLDSQGEFLGAVMIIRDETRINALEQDLKERRQLHNIIGQNQKLQNIYSLIEDLAAVDTTVLITGESGTGKELIAEAIHYIGDRSDKPMVKVNCSALSESLLESELFGHVKGAFTGADKVKVGRFERAGGGTIFLDEIGDISPRIQLRLLRAIQEKEFERVGDSFPRKIDARVIAATNKDLAKKVRLGEFREDLFFRLNVIELPLPPLRERKDDIPLLVNHFIEKLNRKFKKQIISVSEDVQKIFLNYDWPGNIRELEHALEHAFVISKQNIIAVDHLPKNLTEISINKKASSAKTQKLEADLILDALNRAGWNKSKAARLLNINVRTIYRKIDQYDLKE